MDGLIASLEAKYSKSTAHKGKGKRAPSVDPDEPSDAQFDAARYVAELHGVSLLSLCKLCRGEIGLLMTGQLPACSCMDLHLLKCLLACYCYGSTIYTPGFFWTNATACFLVAPSYALHVLPATV